MFNILKKLSAEQVFESLIRDVEAYYQQMTRDLGPTMPTVVCTYAMWCHLAKIDFKSIARPSSPLNLDQIIAVNAGVLNACVKPPHCARSIAFHYYMVSMPVSFERSFLGLTQVGLFPVLTLFALKAKTRLLSHYLSSDALHNTKGRGEFDRLDFDRIEETVGSRLFDSIQRSQEKIRNQELN